MLSFEPEKINPSQKYQSVNFFISSKFLPQELKPTKEKMKRIDCPGYDNKKHTEKHKILKKYEDKQTRGEKLVIEDIVNHMIDEENYKYHPGVFEDKGEKLKKYLGAMQDADEKNMDNFILKTYGSGNNKTMTSKKCPFKTCYINNNKIFNNSYKDFLYKKYLKTPNKTTISLKDMNKAKSKNYNKIED